VQQRRFVVSGHVLGRLELPGDEPYVEAVSDCADCALCLGRRNVTLMI
jgi:hypothetical protein